jgi:hypothetical protein
MKDKTFTGAVKRDDIIRGEKELGMPLLQQIFVVEFARVLRIERFRACSGSL